MKMEKEDEGNLGLQDAVEAMFAAAGKKDWEGAAVAFADAQKLSDDDSGMDDDKEEGDKKPGLAIIFGEKKK
jgi:hypothetical protein